MKNIIIRSSVLLVAVAMLCTSCEPDGLITYEKKPDIYFQYAQSSSSFSNSSTVAFAFMSRGITVDTVSKRVNVTGELANYDRPIPYRILPTTTAIENHHFTVLSAVIPAGAASGVLQIELHRTPDLASDSTVYYIDIDLIPSNEFTTDIFEAKLSNDVYVGILDYHISVSDILVRPRYWNDSYFGLFSVKKFLMLLELLDVAPEFMNGAYNESGQTWSTGYATTGALRGRLFLEGCRDGSWERFEAVSGNWLECDEYIWDDANNQPMDMGTQAYANAPTIVVIENK